MSINLSSIRRTRSRIVAILSASSVVAASIVFGVASTAQASTIETGTITGVVRGGSDTGPTLPGVTMTLVGMTCDQSGDETTKFTTVTGSDGSYAFTDIPAYLDCTVFSSNVHYTLSSSDDPALNYVYSDRSTGIQLSKTVTSAVANVVLLPAATVAGHVTTTALPSVGVPGATVRAYLNDSKTAARTIAVDSSGTFSARGLKAGMYTIASKAPGYNDPASLKFTLIAAQTVSTANFQMSKQTTITGVVSDAFGHPLPGILVSPKDGSAVATSNSVGAFSIGPFVSGVNKSVTFSDPAQVYSTVTLRSDLTKPDADQVMNATLTVAAAVTGTVSAQDTGLPLAGVVVKLQPSVSSQPTLSASTAADGTYRVAGLAPGSYVASFNPNDGTYLQTWWSASPSQGAASEIVVAASQQISGISVRINTPLTLGTVQGTFTQQMPSAGPAGGATVKLVRPSDGKTLFSTVADTAGHWAIGSVIPAKYKVFVVPTNSDYLSEWVGGTTDSLKATVVVLGTAATVSGVDLALSPKFPFASVPVPTISGVPTVGSMLTAAHGTWSPRPDSFTYQWLRKGAPIPGATSSTYLVTSDDLGFKLTVKIRGSLGAETAQTVVSGPTPAVTEVISPAPVPTIAGQIQVGSTLTAKTGVWGPAPVGLAFVWSRDGAAIPGATAVTYTLTTVDLGHRMTVTVTGSKSGYTSVTRVSASTVKVLGELTKTQIPTISALNTFVGTVLAAKTGVWEPDPVLLSFQWLRNGSVISGATAKTYALVAADVGAKISVSVTGSKAGYVTATRTSAQSAVVVGVFISAPTPAVGGTPKVGSNLYVATPAWQPAVVTLTFQWNRSGTAIPGATGTFYKLAAVDLGQKITVTVTGTKPSYNTRSKTSSSTSAIMK